MNMFTIKNILNSQNISNSLSLFFLQISNFLFPFLTVPYLYRTLGVESFGLINLSSAFVQYFIILSDFGFNLSATKYIAENRDDIYKLNNHFFNVLASKLLLFLLGLIILLIIVFNLNFFSEHKSVYILSYGSVLGNVLLPVWFFQGMERMTYVTKITIIIKSLSIAPIFLLVKSDENLFIVPLLYSLGSVIVGIISLIYVKKNFNIYLRHIRLVSFKKIFLCLVESFSFFISRISVSIYTITSSFVLGLVAGNVAVGFYISAEKIYTAFQTVYYPLNQVLYPYMVSKKNIKLFKKIFFYVVLLNSLIVPFLIFESDLIMKSIYSDVNLQSVFVLKILLFACLFTVPSVLLGYPYLGAFGFARLTNLTVIISSIFHVSILGSLFLLNKLTIYSVAYSVLFTEMVVFFLRVFFVRKKINN
jgi:PST family polysaccharide transporter